MSTTALRRCVIGAALGLVLSAAPAWAQLSAAPESLRVSVAQGAEATRVLVLSNAGSEALGFCLNFDRPLEREAGTARLSAKALGTACGAYGEVLALVDESAVAPQLSWDPYGLAMTPDGRLFVSEYRVRQLTYELTPELAVVRSFEHPVVEELTSSASTTGVAYDAGAETLWWLNVEDEGFDVFRALLLEGDLDGAATGRRIELPVADAAPAPGTTGRPGGLAFDAATGRFFFTDRANDDLWAVDTLGVALGGYPVRLDAYPGADFSTVDAHRGSGGLLLDLVVSPEGPAPRGPHLVVADPLGGDLGAGTGLETPLLEPLPGTADGDIAGEPLRSRLDPNGVLYYPWSEFGDAGVVAVRPHPLPPSWLVVSAWDGTLAPGEEVEIALRFRPGQRAVGTYTATLQAFEADGSVVEVPLVMEVTAGTDAEAEAETAEARLSVYPNPAADAATVVLTLPSAASAAEVAVFDVLGRKVAVLHEDTLAAGTHALSLEAVRLPAGVYLVRATAGGAALVQRLTVVR